MIRRYLLLLTFGCTLLGMLYSCQTAEGLKQDTYYVNGRDLYIKHCQNCHGDKGEGLGALVPPLTDSTFMRSYKSRLACIVKNGSADSLTVQGKVYTDKMPGVNLPDIDLAQLIVYITNGFGHKQGMYTSEQVAKDLSDCK